jgi:hypothetical protein
MLDRLAVGRKGDKVSAFAVASELGETLEAAHPGYLVQRRGPAWIAEREALARRR